MELRLWVQLGNINGFTRRMPRGSTQARCAAPTYQMTRSSKGSNSGERYLRRYPAIERWMNQCVACQARGYNPEMPAQIYSEPTFTDRNLRAFFPALALDALGRCDTCAAALEQRDR